MRTRRFVYGYLCVAVFTIVLWNFSFLSTTCHKALKASKINIERVQQKTYVEAIDPNPGQHLVLPPMEAVVSLSEDSDTGILGDVRSVLNVAILGHAKCATTFLLKWLRSHPEVDMFKKEVCDLYEQKPAKLVRRIYTELATENDNSSRTAMDSTIQRGFKCPGHFSTRTLRYFSGMFPETNLIVGLRHPVKYFESYYNFRFRHGKWNMTIPPPGSLIGRCTSVSQGVCTDNARFHVNLAKFGKTDLATARELDLLQWKEKPFEAERVPNNIFVYDVNQLYDKNETRLGQFRSDLATFLGLSSPLLPRPHEVTTGKETALDICKEDELREELMSISKQASVWIREYFMSRVTVSNPDHFYEIVKTWEVDPCQELA